MCGVDVSCKPTLSRVAASCSPYLSIVYGEDLIPFDLRIRRILLPTPLC